VQPVTLEDLALAVERQVIGVFIDQDMGKQARAGTPSLNGAGWQRRLRECLAARAGHARPHDAGRGEPAGEVFQLLGHILAQAAQRAGALGAVSVAGRQLDFDARDMIWDRATLGGVLLLVGLLIGRLQLRRHFGDGDLAGFQRELQLLDRLGGCAKPMVPVAGQLMPQLLDKQRLGLHLGQRKRREPTQALGVFGQRFG
jgi:hypothetical protein